MQRLVNIILTLVDMCLQSTLISMLFGNMSECLINTRRQNKTHKAFRLNLRYYLKEKYYFPLKCITIVLSFKIHLPFAECEAFLFLLLTMHLIEI